MSIPNRQEIAQAISVAVDALDSLSALPELLTPADIADPSSFMDAGWKQITTAQRQQHQRACHKLIDAVNVYRAETDFGRSLIEAATKIADKQAEHIRSVIQAEQSRTDAINIKLAAADREIQHMGAVAEQKELSYEAKLDTELNKLSAKINRYLQTIEAIKLETKLPEGKSLADKRHSDHQSYLQCRLQCDRQQATER